MPVRIRLARHGQRNTPYYHIVAINSSKRRDAKPLEKLGEYDPIPRLPGTSPFMSHHSSGPSSSSGVISPAASALAHGLKKEKRIEWDVERIRHWLNVGAEPTETVVKLLERGGILKGDHKWKLQPKKRGLESKKPDEKNESEHSSSAEPAASQGDVRASTA